MNMINLHPVPWEPETFWERFAPTKNLPILGHELIFLVPVKSSTKSLRVAKVSFARPNFDVAEVGTQTDSGDGWEEYLEQNRAWIFIVLKTDWLADLVWATLIQA